MSDSAGWTRIEQLEAENARLRELVQDWFDDCLNEDCTLCHRRRALLPGAARSALTPARPWYDPSQSVRAEVDGRRPSTGV